MKYILLALILSGCSTASFTSPEDCYKKRQRQKLSEDSIDRGPNTNNDLLDSPDGSSYYNRTVEIFGGIY